MKYDVDFFIRKFSRIPKDRWTTKVFKDSQGRKCALGHCRERGLDDFYMEQSLLIIFRSIGRSVTDVNDAMGIRYPHPHHKDRILAALRDIKKMEEK